MSSSSCIRSLEPLCLVSGSGFDRWVRIASHRTMSVVPCCHCRRDGRRTCARCRRVPVRRQRWESTEKWVFSGEVDNSFCARTHAGRAICRGLNAWCRNILLYSLGWSTPCPRAVVSHGVDFVTPTSIGSTPVVQSGLVHRSGIATGALRRNRGRFTVPSRSVSAPSRDRHAFSWSERTARCGRSCPWCHPGSSPSTMPSRGKATPRPHPHLGVLRGSAIRFDSGRVRA